MDTNIRAILFDSGRVLNYPQSGNWFITPNFFKYVDKNVFNSIPKDKRKLAFNRKGGILPSSIGGRWIAFIILGSIPKIIIP